MTYLPIFLCGIQICQAARTAASHGPLQITRRTFGAMKLSALAGPSQTLNLSYFSCFGSLLSPERWNYSLSSAFEQMWEVLCQNRLDLGFRVMPKHWFDQTIAHFPTCLGYSWATLSWAKWEHPPSSFLSLLFPACTLQVEKVCSSSDEENLQPFKGKMDAFLTQGRHLKNLFQLFSEQLHYKRLAIHGESFKCFFYWYCKCLHTTVDISHQTVSGGWYWGVWTLYWATSRNARKMSMQRNASHELCWDKESLCLNLES